MSDPKAMLDELSSEIKQEMRELHYKIQKYQGGRYIHWGHVGDLNYILELLREANGKDD